MENLHNQLIQACEYYAMLDRYDDAVLKLMDENIDMDIDYDKIKKKGFRAAPGILIIIFTGVFLFLASIIASVVMTVGKPYEELGVMIGTLLGILVIMLTVGAVLIYKLGFCRARTRKIQQKARQEWQAKNGELRANNEKTIDQLMDERQVFEKRNIRVLDFLPDIYRTQLAAAFMERVVRTGRADTLKEAMNLYEEQMHRWMLEEQGHQLLQQKELQTAMIHDQLTEILQEQRRATNSLQNIEALDFYNTFCR